MTAGHLLFIPSVLLVGMFLGYMLAQRAFETKAKMQAEKSAKLSDLGQTSGESTGPEQ